MADELFRYDLGNGEPIYACPFGLDATIILEFAKLGRTEQSVWDLWDSKNEVQKAEAAEIICKVARSAFKLVAFNGRTGEGCSEAMAFDTLRNYRKWGNQKKTTHGETETLPPSTDGESSSGSAGGIQTALRQPSTASG